MNNFTSLIFIVLSIGLGFFFAKPKLAEISELSIKKAQYEEALQNLRSIGELKESLQKKMDSIPPEDLEKIMTLLPATSGTVKLISDVDSIVSKYGVVMDKVAYVAANKSNGQSVSEAQPPAPYNSVIVTFSLKSDYNKFRSILSDMETSLRILDVRNVDIVAGERGLNTYKVEAEIYWMP